MKVMTVKLCVLVLLTVSSCSSSRDRRANLPTVEGENVELRNRLRHKDRSSRHDIRGEARHKARVEGQIKNSLISN